MRFVLDECCPRLFAEVLRGGGHDVVYVAEADSRASDEAIASLAIEEDRLVMTADYDFGELAVRRRRPVPGVILVAPSSASVSARARKLAMLVEDRGVLLMHALTIMEPDRTRFRPLR